MDLAYMYSMANKNASKTNSKLAEASRIFSTSLNKYREEIPPGLLLSHVVLVNPTFAKINDMAHKGFYSLTEQHYSYANVDSANGNDIDVDSYVLCFNLLKIASTLKEDFDTPSEDFWSMVYFKFYLGEKVFNYLYQLITPDPTVDKFCSAALTQTRHTSPNGYLSPVALRRNVTINSLFVLALSRTVSNLSSSTFGRLPVLSKTSMLRTFG